MKNITLKIYSKQDNFAPTLTILSCLNKNLNIFFDFFYIHK